MKIDALTLAFYAADSSWWDGIDCIKGRECFRFFWEEGWMKCIHLRMNDDGKERVTFCTCFFCCSLVSIIINGGGMFFCNKQPSWLNLICGYWICHTSFFRSLSIQVGAIFNNCLLLALLWWYWKENYEVSYSGVIACVIYFLATEAYFFKSTRFIKYILGSAKKDFSMIEQ